MKRGSVILLVCLVVATVAWAQYVDMRASTPAEGYLRGYGDVVRARGLAHLENSAAAINLTEAQKKEIENRSEWTNTYFDMRAANRAYRAAESQPRMSKDDWVRYAQQGAPARLSPSELDTVTGKIHWPAYLQTEEFTAQREKLQPLYVERAEAGVLDYEGYMAVRQTVDAMLEQLRASIEQIPPHVYITSKRFLQNLAYEARVPPS